jgi:hypothetical protein
MPLQCRAVHTVERDRIQYEATVNDPVVFTRPWTIAMPLKRDRKGELLEVACLEDNQDLLHSEGREGAGHQVTRIVVAIGSSACGRRRPRPIIPFTAEFDINKPVKLTGTITMVAWSNPARLDSTSTSKGDDGKVVNWAFETAAANALYRRGTRPEDFPVGTQVTIDGYLARNGTPTATSGKLMFADGRAITIGAGAWRREQK